MTPSAEQLKNYKIMAAEKAVQFVRSGMIVGLGHGSTALLAVRKIADLIKQGRLENIIGIACSNYIEEKAKKLGIPMGSLNEYPSVDLTIDGADEVDPDLNLIKGGGGALLKEKLVAKASVREIIIVDESKLSPVLGTLWALPVEVTPATWENQLYFLENLAGKPTLRTLVDGEPFLTDSGNYIIDCDFGPISDPYTLAQALEGQNGIAEHGLFLGLATDLLVGGESGIQHIQPSNPKH